MTPPLLNLIRQRRHSDVNVVVVVGVVVGGEVFVEEAAGVEAGGDGVRDRGVGFDVGA